MAKGWLCLDILLSTSSFCKMIRFKDIEFWWKEKFSMVPIILKSNKLGISTQNNGYYLLLIIKSTFTAKYCPSEISSRQQNVAGNFHRRVYSKWEKTVEKLNEIFSLVIKCRWKFSSTFLVCWENRAIYARKNKTRTVPFIRACLN